MKIIQINFSYHLKDEKCCRVYYLQDEENKKYVSNLVVYELNMEKYKEIWYTKDEEEIEKSKSIIMLDLPIEELKTLSKKDRMVKKYMSEIKRVNEDPDFFEYMSAEEDNRKIENSIRKEMTEKGLKKGIEQDQKKIVHSMLEQGLDIETISRYTSIDLEVVKKYQSEFHDK